MLYGDLPSFRTWAAARGLVEVADATDDEALFALQRASDHVRFRYVLRLPESQRTVKALPIIEDAAYLCAVREIETRDFFTRAVSQADQKILTKAGELSWTVMGSGSGDMAQPRLTQVDALFMPYLGNDLGHGPCAFIKAVG